MKQKTCKVCRQKYLTTKPLQQVCGLDCAVIHSQNTKAKQQAKEATRNRVELRKAKERAKTRGDWAKESQTAFNAYIRARDNKAGLPCISCNSRTGKQNAGHYRSVGSCPELRYEETQVWLQCEKCNSYLSGNLINYRINLIKRIGIERVEWIEGKHEPQKYTILDLKAIKAEYKLKLKELTK